MRSPVAIARTSHRLYVADFDNDRVQVFSRAGDALLQWGATGSGPGQFRGPAGIAIGADGTVFVTDVYNHRVQRFTGDGDPISEWMAGDDRAAPFGIAVDRLDRVFVTDLEAARVSVWASDGTPVASWGRPGRGAGEMNEPWGIAVDERGDVLVADHANHRVQRFSSDGTWLDAWGDAVTGGDDLLAPMGLALGRDGSIHLSDLSEGRVRRFTPDGGLLATLGDAGDAGGLLATGLAVDEAGDVFVVDTGRHQVIRIPGTPVASSIAAPSEFSMRPIAQPLGRGPVVVAFDIPGSGTLGAEFFAIDGRRVHRVPPTAVAAGEHRITWDTTTDDGHRAPVGVYFVRVHFEQGASRIARSGRIIVLH